MSEEVELVRWFLRDHPEYVPEVAWEVNAASEIVKPLLSDTAFQGFKVWTGDVLSRMTLPQLRQCRDYFNRGQRGA
jgi:hypothetical protein